MKQRSIIFTIFSVWLLVNSLDLYALQHWAMAVVENGKTMPVIIDYHSVAETAENGIEYQRIFDDSYRFRREAYSPVKLKFGYRWVDKYLFIYDFENQKETLALDFNISEGDHFTTFNGMEWKVESARDTLVNISWCGKGESVSKRLLTVKTLDGKRTDQWLEGFGSFTNYFMINSMENVKYAQALWMEYDYGEYLAREIDSDPFFAHDSGWMDKLYDGAESKPFVKCFIEDGQVKFEIVRRQYERREYSFYYRDGDDIYRMSSWEFGPYIDGGERALREDVITFQGLPAPASGNYSIYINNNKYTTKINNFAVFSQPTEKTYDLQGRRFNSIPFEGIYIRDGRKYIGK